MAITVLSRLSDLDGPAIDKFFEQRMANATPEDKLKLTVLRDEAKELNAYLKFQKEFDKLALGVNKDKRNDEINDINENKIKNERKKINKNENFQEVAKREKSEKQTFIEEKLTIEIKNDDELVTALTENREDVSDCAKKLEPKTLSTKKGMQKVAQMSDNIFYSASTNVYFVTAKTMPEEWQALLKTQKFDPDNPLLCQEIGPKATQAVIRAFIAEPTYLKFDKTNLSDLTPAQLAMNHWMKAYKDNLMEAGCDVMNPPTATQSGQARLKALATLSPDEQTLLKRKMDEKGSTDYYKQLLTIPEPTPDPTSNQKEVFSAKAFNESLMQKEKNLFKKGMPVPNNKDEIEQPQSISAEFAAEHINECLDNENYEEALDFIDDIKQQCDTIFGSSGEQASYLNQVHHGIHPSTEMGDRSDLLEETLEEIDNAFRGPNLPQPSFMQKLNDEEHEESVELQEIRSTGLSNT